MADPSRMPDRYAMEERLRKKVEDAKTKYEAARVKARSLTRTSPDSGAPDLDGNRSIAEAARAEAQANRDYAEAIHALSLFILHGKVPRD